MATPQEQLASAQAAYHDLQIGKSARVYVDQNGERVEYVAANRDSLKSYIAELQAIVAAAATSAAPYNGPLRPFFL